MLRSMPSKGVFTAANGDQHHKDGQRLNQQLHQTLIINEELLGMGGGDDDVFESLGFYGVFDSKA